MPEEVQSWLTVAVVITTGLIFFWRYVRARNTAGCGGGCACSMKRKK